MPFTDCSADDYERMISLLKDIEIDLTEITEVMDNTDLSSEAACSGGACEVSSI